MRLKKASSPLYEKPAAWLVALFVFALILAALELANVVDFIKTPATNDSSTAQEAEQEKANKTTKQDFIEKAPVAKPAPIPQDSNSVALSASQDGDSVTILTKLRGFPSGVCDLAIANGNKTHSVSADVIYQPEFSSCAGFSIPVAKLGAGQWSITLKATPTGGSALTKSIPLEVK